MNVYSLIQFDKQYVKSIADKLKNKANLRLQKPLKLYAAKTKGYKSNDVVILTSIKKGNRVKPLASGGRKNSKYGMLLCPKINHKDIAINRVLKKHINLKFICCNYVYDNGKRQFFEVIMRDAIFFK